MIDPVVNRNLGNIFHHKKLTNYSQYLYQPTGQQYQPITFLILNKLCIYITERELYSMWTWQQGIYRSIDSQ